MTRTVLTVGQFEHASRQGSTCATQLNVAQMRQLSIEYAPEPPYAAGSPETATAAVVSELLARRQQMLTGG